MPIGLSPRWAAPLARDGTAWAIPPFRERLLLPFRERLLLPVPGDERLAARLDRRAGPMARPLVVLVHGLAGTEASRSVVASTRQLAGQGWTVLRLNLRGALPSLPTAAGHYHAGRTEDLAEALRGLPAELTRYGIVLLGHSLGGNLVLKFMGEGGAACRCLLPSRCPPRLIWRRPVPG